MRGQLERFAGRVVFVRGVIDRKTRAGVDRNGIGCFLLKHVEIDQPPDPVLTVNHLWIKPISEYTYERYNAGDRISFYARVCRYVRADGSIDYGLKDPYEIVRS